MTKQFKPGIGKIISRMSFYTAVVISICFFITMQYFVLTKTARPDGFLIPACAVAVTTAIAVASLKVLYFDYLVIDVNEHEVTFTRRRGGCKSYRISDHMFSSNVTKHYYNGIYTSTTKYIIVTELGSDKKKIYACNIFNTNDFNQIFSYINSIESKQEIDDEEETNFAAAYTKPQDVHSVFTIDKDLAVKDTRDDWRIMTVGGTIVFVVASIAVLLFRRDRASLLEFYKGYYIFILMLSPLMSTINLIVARIRINMLMPGRIILTSNSISFDNQMFEFGEVKTIIATPLGNKRPNAYSNQRVITIVLHSGKKHSFILGEIHIDPSKPQAFAQYWRLCYELKELFLNEPEKFMLKME